MEWGVQTWNANGVPNNYGIKPVSVYGTQVLANGQKSGSWTVSVPLLKVKLLPRRKRIGRRARGMGMAGVELACPGNTITVSAAGRYGIQ